MKDVVVIGAARTPFGNFGGMLKDFSTVQLGAIAVREAVRRAGIKPSDVEEVYIGANMPCSNRSIARQVALEAGIPEDKNAATIDRACCSSMAAIAMGYRAIKLGEIDVAVGGGTENMSQVPYFIEDLRWGKRLGDITLKDILVVKCPYTGVPRAVQAGVKAVEYGITREDQDKWALRSQTRYWEAFRAGKFKDEIVPVEVPQRKGNPIIMDKDEPPREGVTLEALAKLPTVYGSPTVTAGNAPGLNTGAAAIVMTSSEKAEALGVTPLGTIVAHAQASGHPDGIATIPAFAALKVLEKAKMSIDDIDIIEINEAFAAMPLVSTKILGEGDDKKVEAIRAKTNVNGGAIAIGHPTGATGARLVMRTLFELRRRGGGYGLVTICGGIGEGEAFVLKV